MNPQCFEREMKCIHFNYFIVWDNEINRWVIREWIVDHPTERDARIRDLWERKSLFVSRVCIRSDDYKDIGYKPLDQRTLFALKRTKRECEDFTRVQKEVDEHNARLEESFDKEIEYQSRYVAGRIWHKYQEPTVY